MKHTNMENAFTNLRRKALDAHEKTALWVSIESRLDVLPSSLSFHQTQKPTTFMPIVASMVGMLIFAVIAGSALHNKLVKTSTGAQHETKPTNTKVTTPNVQQTNNQNFNNWFGDLGLQNAAKNGYALPFVQSQKDKGITVTIRNVVYDQGRLAFRWVSNGKEAGGLGFGPNGIHLSVNGHPYKNSSFQGGGAGRFFGPNHANGLIEISPFKPLPQKFILGITDYAVGNIRGQWKFNIPVSRVKSDAATKTYQLHRSRTFDQVTLNLSTVTLTPSAVVVESSLTMPTTYHAPLEVVLIDSNGNVLHSLVPKYLGTESSSSHQITTRYRYLFPSPGTSANQFIIAPFDYSHQQRNAVLKEKLGIQVNLTSPR